MKALVFESVGKVAVRELPTPEPKAGEALVQVKACGVCGTDYHIYGGDEGAAKCQPPLVLGHEFSGVVAAVGAGVTGLSVGDRVAVDPNLPCGGCRYCRLGKPHFCEAMSCYGTVSNGGFAEYCVADARACHKIPDALGFAAGAMSEPVSCCLHGIDLCQIKPGSDALVIGLGPIGQMMAQLAASAGAARVAAIEPVAARRESAAMHGVSLCVDPSLAGGTEGVAKALRDGGFDCFETVIECAGRPDAMRQAVSLAGFGATVMLFGLASPSDVIQINPFEDLFKKEIKLCSSFINPLTFSRSIALLASGRVRTAELVTDEVPLLRAPEVFSDASYRRRGKTLIIP